MKRTAFALALAAALGLACSKSSSTDAPRARTCAVAPPAPSDARLRTDGTRFRDALGRTVALRGVNAGGRSKFAPFAPFDFDPGSPESYAKALAQYMDRAASWGIDV